MTDPEDENEASPEPQFGKLWEQEESHSRRVKIVFGLVFGPAVVLALLGYYEAAIKALGISFIAAFALLRLLSKLDDMDM